MRRRIARPAAIRSKPKPIIHDRCGVTGKRRYRSKGAARDALAETRERRAVDVRRKERRIYRCISCAGWHLTSKVWEPPMGTA